MNLNLLLLQDPTISAAIACSDVEYVWTYRNKNGTKVTGTLPLMDLASSDQESQTEPSEAPSDS